MAVLTELNRISIASICVYTPALVIAILLSIRHGFGRSAGWMYLILFSLIRIIGSALELATINDPTNIDLIIGASTLQNIGLSPLILVMLGLAGRVLESISHSRSTILQPRMLRLVQMLVLVGLILGIVGGSKLGGIIGKNAASGQPTAAYKVPTESVAGLALMIAGYGILVIATCLLATQISAAEPGEKRLLLAVAVALPFVLVRLIFSAISTFDPSNPDFRRFGGSSRYPDLLLGMAVIEEMIAIAIFEVVGLTLRKIPKGERKTLGEAMPLGNYRGGRHQPPPQSRQPHYQQHEQGVSNV